MTVLNFVCKILKNVFYFFIINTQCTSTPSVLARGSVYISNTHPVILWIFSYTPLGMVLCIIPLTEASCCSIDIFHFEFILFTEGCIPPHLAAPRLDEQITADFLCDIDIKIFTYNNNSNSTGVTWAASVSVH